MTLKSDVKAMFSRRPCFFQWGEDDTQAVSQGSAVLQCKNDHTASLMVMMPQNNDRVMQYNVTLLVLLAGVAGLDEGEAWIAQCFREAKNHSRVGVFNLERDKLYTLVCDREHGLTTLTIKEPPSD